MMGCREAARLFADCWGLYKKYFGADMTDADWNRLCNVEVYGLWEKYRREKFAKELVLDVVDEIGKMQGYKEARRKGNGR